MLKRLFIPVLLAHALASYAQIPVARDTITVIENGYVLKMPWADGLNFANVSSMDVNDDGKKDIVIFDRLNIYGGGHFRCFIHTGNPGQIKYKEDWYSSHLFPQVSNWAVLKDYNCDGKEDLFCSTSAGIKVYKNTSNGSYVNFTLVKPLLNSDYYPPGPPAMSNLYASSVGVPGIADIDGDTDLDILTFSPEGVFIEYHKNLSIEKGYHCDSLIFQYSDRCWGKISENNCQVNLNQCPPARPGNFYNYESSDKPYHQGSCLTCFDSDGDQDQDLVMGDVLCDAIQYAHNTGDITTAVFSDTTKRYPNYPNKSNTTQVKLNIFPCAYVLDVDGDTKKDLIVTPNSLGSENYKSVWFYKNTSTTNTVNFQFVKNNFLQDEMIDVGQNSFPVLFDYDQDGRKDLLIGNYGYYSGASLNARLTLYRNTSTNTAQPSYSLISRDYGSLSTRTLSSGMQVNNAMPTVGDIDFDGDEDILIGTSSGQIHWLENTAGNGIVCNFSNFKQNPFGFTTNSGAAAPQLFDMDGDMRLDLLIGMQNGRIAFYKNISTSQVPTFTLITNFLGAVDVKGDPNLFGYEGYATPFFYRDGSSVKLLVGSFPGTIAQYDVPSVLTNSFTLITKSINGYNEGSQSTVWYEDVNNDSKRDLIIGNSAGGLNFFSSRSPYVGIEEFNTDAIASQVSVFPNPAGQELKIKIDLVDFQKGSLRIYDVLGKGVFCSPVLSNEETLDISGLDKGIYFADFIITTDFQNTRVTKKIIKD